MALPELAHQGGTLQHLKEAATFIAALIVITFAVVVILSKVWQSVIEEEL